MDNILLSIEREGYKERAQESADQLDGLQSEKALHSLLDREGMTERHQQERSVEDIQSTLRRVHPEIARSGLENSKRDTEISKGEVSSPTYNQANKSGEGRKKKKIRGQRE